MLDLSTAARMEKNKLETDGAYIILAEIIVKDSTTLTVCRNTDDVVWNGKTWVAFPFELDAPTDSMTGELPRFSIRVSNITRAVEGYIEDAGGGVGSTVNIHVLLVRADGTVFNEAFMNQRFTVQSTSYDAEWVTFNLSGSSNLYRRVPERRFLKTFCPFVYKGAECKATSSLLVCGKTLEECRDRNNAIRYGGEPAIPQGGLYGRR